MLSPVSEHVIRATLPVVSDAIDEIVPVFYRRMFAAHPELERDLFNRANQARGDQQAALAQAIVGYAELLITEGVDETEVLPRIAHKHASLGVTPPQYAVVHEHLFGAIVEVLGDAITPEVAAAWDEVYWRLAETLIALEQGLYDAAGVRPGDVWRELRVLRRRYESPDTLALELVAADGGSLPQAHPGQYVSVAVHLADGARQIRQYSLTRTEDATRWRISIKVVAAGGEPAGEVSSYVHDHVFEGDLLQVSPPFGDLRLTDRDTPIVLVSAGIGITPMVGFLHHLHETGSRRELLVLHADRSPALHAHRAEVNELVEALPFAAQVRWYEEPGSRPVDECMRVGRIDLGGVSIPPDADVYLCGPVPFMAAVHQELSGAGVDEARIHYEVFGPSTALPTPGS